MAETLSDQVTRIEGDIANLIGILQTKRLGVPASLPTPPPSPDLATRVTTIESDLDVLIAVLKTQRLGIPDTLPTPPPA